MTTIHPHWEETSSTEPVEGDVVVHGPTPPPTEAGTAISRKPAAILGIGLVFCMGYGFFLGLDSLTGQVSQSKVVSVEIQESGLVPQRIEVEHGQTITWTNKTDTAHILHSDVLCSDTGYCLSTKTLFNGDSDNFTITQDIKEGTYRYTSSTSDDLSGQISIYAKAEPGGQDEFQDLTSVLEDDFFQNPDIGEVDTGTVDSETDIPSMDALFDSKPETEGIPENPYAGEVEHEEVVEKSEEEMTVQEKAEKKMRDGNAPASQPETGARFWLVIAGSIAGLAVASRKHLKAFV